MRSQIELVGVPDRFRSVSFESLRGLLTAHKNADCEVNCFAKEEVHLLAADVKSVDICLCAFYGRSEMYLNLLKPQHKISLTVD